MIVFPALSGLSRRKRRNGAARIGPEMQLRFPVETPGWNELTTLSNTQRWSALNRLMELIASCQNCEDDCCC